MYCNLYCSQINAFLRSERQSCLFFRFFLMAGFNNRYFRSHCELHLCIYIYNII